MDAQPTTFQHDAASHALRLPEVVHAVLEHVDQQTLSRSTYLVNHLWAEETFDLLWRNPSVEAFAAVKAARRQYYADRIRSLVLEESTDWDLFSTLDTVAFPRLVSLDSYCIDLSVLKNRLFVSTLDSLSFSLSSRTESQLDWIKDNCPHMQRMCVIFSGRPAFRHLLDLSRDYRLWRVVIRNEPVFETIPEHVLTDLASNAHLQELSFCSDVRLTADLENAIQNINTPFPAVSSLTIFANAQTATMLISAMESLIRLVLFRTRSEPGASERLFVLLARSHKLRDLQLSLLVQEDFVQAALRELGNQPIFKNIHCLGLTITDEATISLLTALQPNRDILESLYLEISPSHPGPATCEISINEILSLLGCFKKLRMLSVKWDTQLVSDRSFSVLSKLVNLERLDLQFAVLTYSNVETISNFYSSFPHMLSFYMRYRLGRHIPLPALLALASTSKLLQSCSIDGKQDMESWREIKPPMFPNLDTLHLNYVPSPDIEKDSLTLQERAVTFVDILLQHCPRLKRVFFEYYNSPLGERMQDVLDAQRNEVRRRRLAHLYSEAGRNSGRKYAVRSR